jgi:GNAT superfamily N-acetyltransferase
MSKIQIYYLIPSQLNRSLNIMNIDLNLVLNKSNKTIDQVRNEIKIKKNFCRDEYGIEFNYLYSSLISDISLYASLDEKIIGILTFMFMERDNKRYILLNGICVPEDYSGLGVGKELINTLILIGKTLNINYINLDCKGNDLMNYYKKFGFTVLSENMAEDSDDEEMEINYTMTLDLSKVSGGKHKNKKLLKKSKRIVKIKRKNTRRKFKKRY